VFEGNLRKQMPIYICTYVHIPTNKSSQKLEKKRKVHSGVHEPPIDKTAGRGVGTVCSVPLQLQVHACNTTS
jgi:hypothetical protein